MSEPTNRRKAKKRKQSFAALVQDGGVQSGEDNLVLLGNRLSNEAIARSGLLSGVENTEGLAQLPGHLTPEEVKLWETAAALDVDLSPDELVTVLKVADTLGDVNIDKWQKELVGMLMSAKWDTPGGEELLGSFLRLPAHLSRSILSTLISRKTLSHLLQNFPSPLRVHLTTAAASSGEIEISHSQGAEVLPLLPLLPSENFPIHTVCMAHPDIMDMPIGPLALFKVRPSTGALLAQAAAAHTTITTLQMDVVPLPLAWINRFTTSLPPGALPRLTLLRICIAANPADYGSLISCIALLPSLKTLRVTIHITPTSKPSSSGSQTHGAHASAHHGAKNSLRRFVAAGAPRASLPCLEELYFVEGHHASVMPLVAYKNGAPGEIHPSAAVATGRSLEEQRGHYVFCAEQPSGAHTFLSALDAPGLRRLELVLGTAPVNLQRILSKLHRFPVLLHLALCATVILPPKPGVSDPADRTSSGSDREDDARAVKSHDSLASAEVNSTCIGSATEIAARVVDISSATLKRLDVVARPKNLMREKECSPAYACRACKELLGCLRRCTRLEGLNLSCLRPVSGGYHIPIEPQFCGELRGALSSLHQLTALSLRPAAGLGVLRCPGAGMLFLSSLTSLQSLSMRQISILSQEDAVDDLAGLKHLTQLQLGTLLSNVQVEKLRRSLPMLRDRAGNLSHAGVGGSQGGAGGQAGGWVENPFYVHDSVSDSSSSSGSGSSSEDPVSSSSAESESASDSSGEDEPVEVV